MIRKLIFFIVEAVIGMRRASVMIFIAYATIFISLLIFGFFLIVHINLSSFSVEPSKENTVISCFSD